MSYEIHNLVDNSWNCGCGALNAAYRETCGRCNKPNPQVKNNSYVLGENGKKYKNEWERGEKEGFNKDVDNLNV